MKRIIRNILAVSAIAVASVACVDDRNNFMVDDSFGFNHTVKPVIEYPLYGGSYDLSIIKSGKGLADAEVKITGSEFDLIKYNEGLDNNAKKFVAFSKDLYSFSSNVVSFKAEEAAKLVTVTWDPAAVKNAMTDVENYEYAIPVGISSSDLTVNEGREFVILNLKQVKFDVVNKDVNQTLLLEKPAKTSTQLTLRLDLAIPSDDVVADFVIDEELIAAYNESNGTSYTMAPEGAVTLSASSATIAKGSKEGFINVNFDSSVFFEEDGVTPNKDLAKEYLVPVKVSKVSVDGLVLGNTVTYVKVKAQVPLPPALFDRIWGYYSDKATEKGWCTNELNIPGLDGNDRSFAMDNDYVYVPQATGGDTEQAFIHKFKISDGSYDGYLPVTDVMKQGTHYASCARTVKNAAGDYVLLVCNLSLDQTMVLSAYLDGTDNAPVTVTTAASNRRWGDKFTVDGTWESGNTWWRSYDDRGMVGFIPLQGKTKDEGFNWNWYEAHAIDGGTAFDANNISEVTWYPSTTGYCILNTNSEAGAHLMEGKEHAKYTEVATYPALARTFGWNFFEIEGEKHIAFVSMAEGAAKPSLQVIKGDGSSLDALKATLDAYPSNVIFKAYLQDPLSIEVEGFGGMYAGDCCVREIDGRIYIAAGTNKVGLSMFRFNPDFVAE